MPAVKLNKYVDRLKRPPVDRLMQPITERIKTQGLSYTDISKSTGLTKQQITYLMSKPTDEWPVGRMKAICKAVGVELEDCRNAIRY